ncbi:hypothetical protein DFH09DRAFT_1003634 [Mycena vulgaris]|nr:hypothetical protein DFH09DRAFT_1003634 [Mycena vulgaris]
MADNVPDEIISEILSPALRVPDEAFSDTSDDPIFMSFSESSSSFLLVSKSWLRVATPLLYNVVVLRSKAQAQALAATLKSNPDLGRFIRKLRVEGGYAISMYKILQASTNITHLFLSLEIVADNACGLCRGLPLIDPGHVILHNPLYNALSAAAYKLLDTLQKCIPTWKRLAAFDIPHTLPAQAAFTISEALVKAPNLSKLLISDPSGISHIPAYVREIASNPSLKCIQLKTPMLLRPGLIDALEKDLKMKGLFKFPDEGVVASEPNVPLPSHFVYPVRLASNPVQEDAIWSRVLRFALHAKSNRPRYWNRTAPPSNYLAPLLVSRTFFRLGIPLLYESPILNTSFAVGSFAYQIAQKPTLRNHVRFLTITHFGDLTAFKTIIAHTPALVELHGGDNCSPVTWKAFNDLGGSTGSCLRVFQGVPVAKATGAASPAVFSRFSRIRSFCWNSRTEFKIAPNLIQNNAFDTLVELTVNSFDSSFLAVLSHMELPSLRIAVFSAMAADGTPFFRKHGRKLQELTVSILQIANSDLGIFHNCPSVTVLRISCDEKTLLNLSSFKPSDKHACLERIVFLLPDFYRMKQPQRVSCGRFLLSLDSTSFPALREIEHPHCSWPTSESEISKSHWVRWAEALQDRNIQLFKTKDMYWRRRLKFMPKKATKNVRGHS